MGYTPSPASAAGLHIYWEAPTSPRAWAEIKGGGSYPYYVLMGTIRYQQTLTTYPTLDFAIYSDDASFSPDVGTPIKMTFDGFGDIFGGKIEQAQIDEIPAHPHGGIITSVQCTSWEKVLTQRLLVLAGAIPAGNTTDTFAGDGTTTSWMLSKYPTGVISVKIDGVAQTFGQYGETGVDWWWGVYIYAFNSTAGVPPVGVGHSLVVNYDAVGVTTTPPTYVNMTAGAIVTTLMGLIADEGFTVVIDDAGPTIDSITFTLQDTIASALDSLCRYIANGTNIYRYYITPGKVLHFEVQGVTRTAPWTIQESTGSDGNILINVRNTITAEKYANAALVNVSNALTASQLPARFIGDGTTRTFQTTYPVGQTPTITLYTGGTFPIGGIPQTVGVRGTTGSQWYWSAGSTALDQDASGTTLTSSDVLDVQYAAQVSQSQTYVDPVSVAARKLIEGGSGEHDLYLDLNSTLPFVLVKGMNLAQNLALAQAVLSSSLEISTYRSGLETGAAAPVDLPRVKASGTFVVDSVTITDPNNLALWEIRLSQGAVIGDWKTAVKGLVSGGSSTVPVTTGASGSGFPSTIQVSY